MASAPVASSYPRSYFYFDACSQALTAQFMQPADHYIDAQASSSLCSTGGRSRARVDNYSDGKFISFAAGYTEISAGYEDDEGSNDTKAIATVEGLNILDVVTADLVVASTYSEHPAAASEGSVSMEGCTFENLRIHGRPVKMELNFPLFEGIETFKQARDAFHQKGEFWQIAKDPFQSGQELPPQKETGAFLCSLIKGGIQVDAPGVQTAGHTIVIPNFGTIYLAEMMIIHGQRTFSMIRFNLDATVKVPGSVDVAVKATGSVACGTTNGRQYPPH
jgi:hypothetical protein